MEPASNFNKTTNCHFGAPCFSGQTNQTFPADVLNVIFSYLPQRELANTQRVCRQWRTLTFKITKNEQFKLFFNLIEQIINNLKTLNEERYKILIDDLVKLKKFRIREENLPFDLRSLKNCLQQLKINLVNALIHWDENIIRILDETKENQLPFSFKNYKNLIKIKRRFEIEKSKERWNGWNGFDPTFLEIATLEEVSLVLEYILLIPVSYIKDAYIKTLVIKASDSNSIPFHRSEDVQILLRMVDCISQKSEIDRILNIVIKNLSFKDKLEFSMKILGCIKSQSYQNRGLASLTKGFCVRKAWLTAEEFARKIVFRKLKNKKAELVAREVKASAYRCIISYRIREGIDNTCLKKLLDLASQIPDVNRADQRDLAYVDIVQGLIKNGRLGDAKQVCELVSKKNKHYLDYANANLLRYNVTDKY